MSKSNLTAPRAEVICIDDIIQLIEDAEGEQIDEEYVELLNAEETLLLSLYRHNLCSDADIVRVMEAYLGRFNKPADWAEQYFEESGLIEETPELLRFYLDFDAWADDARLSGDVRFIEKDGWTYVFSCH